MIPVDFAYYKPSSVDEAVAVFVRLRNENRNPVYYGGGTEIISMARVGNIRPDAVIDIKGIPELQTLGFSGSKLVIGAAVPLTSITESNYFPLLGLAGGRVADHTIQRKITLGGNMMGTIIYREAVLPLLLADCRVIAAGPEGRREVQIQQVFDGRLRLKPGELLIQVLVDRIYTECPYVHVKKTRQDKIDYPLVTVTALKKDGHLRAAVSGLCGYPFRSRQVEAALNDRILSRNERVRQAMERLPASILDDTSGSAEYRRFVFQKTMTDMLDVLEGVSLC